MQVKESFIWTQTSTRYWYVKIDTLFFHQCFIKSKSDPNKQDGNAHIVLIYLYVNDRIITRSVARLIEEIKRNLSQEFEMNDLGQFRH